MAFSFGEGSLTSGQPVVVHCTVLEGDMPLTIRWAFHGKELSSQMGISIIKAGPKMSLLTIDSVAAGHSGNYTCTASNNASTVNYTATLAVNGLTPRTAFLILRHSPLQIFPPPPLGRFSSGTFFRVSFSCFVLLLFLLESYVFNFISP